MTRLEALTALHEAVEAGSWLPDLVANLRDLHTDLTWKAFSGSLDAARALHEAVLPGWVVGQIGQAVCDGTGGWSVWIVAPDYLESCEQSAGQSDCPARAWLIVILAALIAQEQDQ